MVYKEMILTRRDAVRLCLRLDDAFEDFPFGDDVSVMRHESNRKMFALICIHDGLVCMNLKAEPQDVLRYIEEYSAVVPGWHMNKKYWVTVLFDGSMDAETVQEMIANSHRLTAPKQARDRKKRPCTDSNV